MSLRSGQPSFVPERAVLKHTINLTSPLDTLVTGQSPARSTIFAIMADFPGSFESGTLTNLDLLGPFSESDDYSSAFVTSALDAQFRHCGSYPVMKGTSLIHSPVAFERMRTSSGPVRVSLHDSSWEYFVLRAKPRDPPASSTCNPVVLQATFSTPLEVSAVAPAVHNAESSYIRGEEGTSPGLVRRKVGSDTTANMRNAMSDVGHDSGSVRIICLGDFSIEELINTCLMAAEKHCFTSWGRLQEQRVPLTIQCRPRYRPGAIILMRTIRYDTVPWKMESAVVHMFRS